MDIHGASCIVTGGGSGLGHATAQALLRRGAIVTVIDLPSAGAERAVDALGGGACFAPADVADVASVEAAIVRAQEQGPLRAVVHCAGRGGDRRRILSRDGGPGDYDSFLEVIRINLGGTYNVLRLAAAAMASNELLDGDRGVFVLTASVAAFDGQIGQTSYAAAKAGVHGMTLVAARDLADYAIRVNTIAPGVFDTPMLGRLPVPVRDGLAASVPHPKRLGDPADYARMAIALIETAYVNGETVRLDGGIRMSPR